MTLWRNPSWRTPSLKERAEAKRRADEAEARAQTRITAQIAARRVAESALPAKEVSAKMLREALEGSLVAHRSSRDPALMALIAADLIKVRHKHDSGDHVHYKATRLGRAYLARQEIEPEVLPPPASSHSLYGVPVIYHPASPPYLQRPQQRSHEAVVIKGVDPRRQGAEAQRNISAALRDAEMDPFKIDTGWLGTDDRHPVRVLYQSAMRRIGGVPLGHSGGAVRGGFTQLRHVSVRTRLYRRHFDARVRPMIEVVSFHTLGGGGAVILCGRSDELAEMAPIHDAEIAAWAERWRAAGVAIPRDQWPTLTKLEPDERFIFLGSHPGIETFLAMEFR